MGKRTVTARFPGGALALLLALSPLPLPAPLQAQAPEPASPQSQAQQPQPLSSVADLRYGVALFHYYQDNYFDALSELMVADQRGGIQGHGDNPALVQGGLKLAFGMQTQARDAFNQLLDAGRPQQVRDTAWFYLGKLQYQQAQWDAAEASFDKVSNQSDPRLATELAAMRLQIWLRTDNYPQALASVSQAGAASTELSHYNLGVALARRGDAVAAQAQLAQVGLQPLASEPQTQKLQRALRDRALTASGYVHLQQGEYPEAEQKFQQVRLTGPYSDRALLGLGWAYASQDQWQKALSPWQALSRQSLQLPSALEAQLALPWAYEQLGADPQALQAFEAAEQTYQRELAAIDSLRQQLSADLLRQAIARDYQQHQSWLALQGPAALKPELAYLAELFARNDFQTRVQALRDLMAMQASLDQWRQRQAIYADLLVQRGDLRARKLAALESAGQLKQAPALTREGETLRHWLATVVSEKDYLALVTDQDSLDHLARVDQALANAEALEDAEALAQLRFYRGLLLWQAQEQFSDNLWTQKRQLMALAEGLEALKLRQQSLLQAIEQAPEIQPYQQRMSLLDQRLAAETVAVEQQLNAESDALRQQVVAALDDQRKRVKSYLARARLAIARLYDERLKP